MNTCDLLQIIVDFSKIKESLFICRLNKKTYKKIKIHYLNEDKFSQKITNKILKQKKYSHLISLNLSNNSQILNVNHMKNLKILDAGEDCGIDDEGISKLNLIELDASYNEEITNVNHMTNLKILDAGENCGIDDEGISKLNLIKLDASGNNKIRNVNHMTNLKILYASGDCGINNKGISKLNLIELDASCNNKITNV